MAAIITHFGLCAQVINTVIGGVGDWGQATAAELYQPNCVAVDKQGNVYLGENGTHIRRITPAGIITSIQVNSNVQDIAVDTFGSIFIATGSRIYKVTVAGDSTIGSYGSNAVAVDLAGNVYMTWENSIKKTTPSGIVTIAGTATAGYSGDAGPATAATLNGPNKLCVDRTGNVYVSDFNNNVVRKIDTSGIITTVAGLGTAGYTGNGGPATAATFNQIEGISVDTSGNLFIADYSNNEIRKVNLLGIVSQFAGYFSTGGFAGDGGPATAAQLNAPIGIATDQTGVVYFADYNNNRIRKVNLTGTISTFAGCQYSSASGFKGDGGPAISALINSPAGLCYDAGGNLYIADANNACVRKVNTSSVISTIARNDTAGYSGDGGPATAARLTRPVSVAADRHGNIFICDYSHDVIRKVSSAGVISTFAGTGGSGYSGDGHRADSAKLASPGGIATDRTGNLYIADVLNNCIRKVDTNQIISTIAGTTVAGYFGDGGAATAAQLNKPLAVYCDTSGNIYITDYSNNRIRKISAGGIINSVATVTLPAGITSDRNGNLLAITGNSAVKINTAGIVTTLAGSGSGSGFSGDGGLATAAVLSINNGILIPAGIVTDTANNVYIADRSNSRIRKINSASITINTGRDTVCSGTPVIFNATTAGMAGYSVFYQWKKNSFNVGTNSATYTADSVQNGDKITCYVNNGAAGMTVAISNTYTMTVIPNDTVPSVSFSTSSTLTPICIGDTVKCTAAATFGGSSPVYDWYKNHIHAFTGNVYSFVPSPGGDSVYCKLTSNVLCLRADTAVSLTQKIKPTAPILPTVSISTSNSTACYGTSATIYSSVGTGTSYSSVFTFYLNGTVYPTSAGSDMFSFVPHNHDSVYCKITTRQHCIVTDTAISNGILFTTNPSVSINASPGNAVCPGTNVTLTPASVLGGAPRFDWYLNGVFNSTGGTFHITPNNGDSVYCIMTSSSCTSPATARSATVIFTVGSVDVASVTFSASTGDSVCPGSVVTCTANPVYGGAAPAYYWFKNGALADTGRNFAFTPANGDQVSCTMVSNSACVVHDTVASNSAFFWLQTPVPASVSLTVIPGDTICSGSTASLQATAMNGSSDAQFSWFVNNQHYYTGNSFNYRPLDNDLVFCQMISSVCTTPNPAVSDTVKLTVLQKNPPTVTMNISLGNTLCAGTPVSCIANGTDTGPSPQYTWFLDGNTVGTGMEYDFTPQDGDVIHCKLVSNAACVAPNYDYSNAVIFRIEDNPSITISQSTGPVIYRGTNVTFTSEVTGVGTFGYQWMKNGKPIYGATSATYSSSDFNYWDSVYCVLASMGACQGTFVSNGLLVDTYHGVDVYPNPNNGNFTINLNDYNANSDAVVIRIFNETGRLVYEQQSAFSSITFYTSISLKEQLPPGVYLLRLSYKNNEIPYVFSVKY